MVCVVKSIVKPDSTAVPVRYPEADSGKRLIIRALNVLLNNQGGGRLIVKGQAVVRAAFQGDRLRHGVPDISAGGLCLGYGGGCAGGNARDCCGAVPSGDIAPARFVHLNCKLCSGQRLQSLRIPFHNRQRTKRGIVKAQGLRVLRIDNYGLFVAVVIKGIALRGLYFLNNDGSGDAGNGNLASAVSRIDAVARQMPVGRIHYVGGS